VANRGVGAAVGTNASDRGVFCGGRRRERRGHTVPPGGVPAWFAAIGWSDGRNIQIDYRWGGGNAALIRRYAEELVALSPDVIFSSGAATVAPLLQVTRTVPIVFAGDVDPVGAGFVDNLARPGGNATGFILFEYSLGGKLLELLKQVAPSVTRAAVIRDAALSTGTGQFGAIQSVAPSLGVEVSPVNLRDAPELEGAIANFARSLNGGLVVTSSALAVRNSGLIIALAARHKLPAVYYRRQFVIDGGLIAYGPDIIDQNRRAAGYVDRMLKGEKPGDLPVQAPTKYELIVNLKTAKALSLDVPPTLLARADDSAGGRKPINAKCETVRELPTFRDAYRKRRCVVPVDGFFEWKAIKGQKAKQPYAIAMKDGAPFGIAGIWENWKDPGSSEWIRTFAVITTDANEIVADIHDRMPVILAPSDYARWLGEEPDPRDLMRSFSADLIRMWPISTRVNKPENDDRSLVEPIELATDAA
jgi:putative ABC transport system substrate-binding protein